MMVVSGGCVGRDHEIALILRRLSATGTDRAAGPGVVLVTGPAGVGKSRLLAGVVAAAQVPVRSVQGLLWEQELPGALLDQLFDGPVPTDPLVAATDLVEMLSVDGPGLLLVDDAHHADERSLQVLSSALRHHRSAPFLIVAAAPAPTTQLIRLTEYVGETITLAGLDAAGVSALATQRGHTLHPSMVDQLTRHTDGHPRDVVALLDELPTSLWTGRRADLPAPAYIVAQVRDSLARCCADGQALVEALAVLDQDESPGVVAALAGIDDLAGAIDDATSVGLLAPGRGVEPCLRDRLVRAAVLEVIGLQASGAAHRRAADLVSDEVRRIGHLVAATLLPDDELADRVDRLARERGRLGAWSEAATLFRQASRLTADPMLRETRLVLSFDALIADGDVHGAGVMVPMIESLRETPLRNAALAYLAIVRGRAIEAEVRLRRAWDIVNVDLDPEAGARIAQRWVLHSLSRGQGLELVSWADEAIRLGGKESVAGVEGAAIRGLGNAAAGRWHAAVDDYRELDDRRIHGPQAARIRMGRGWLALARDEIDEARTALEGALATAALGGSARISLWALGWLARVQFHTGDWDGALRSVAQGRELVEHTGMVLIGPLLEWTAAQVLCLRRRPAAAAQAARAAEVATQGYEVMQVPAALARAHLFETEADHSGVLRVLAPLTRIPDGTSLGEPSFWPWDDVYANALVLTGDHAAADEFLRPREQRARERGRRSAQARLGYARGRLLGAQGDLPAARDQFERSLHQLDGLPLRYDRARVTFAYGQTLRRAGKRRDADVMISMSRELWEALGAESYVARCDQELKAGGVRVPRSVRGPSDLTPQEETVGELVSSGLSNREVAARIFLSPKTVQYHLTRIYSKLGVRSRAELAAVWGERAAHHPGSPSGGPTRSPGDTP